MHSIARRNFNKFYKQNRKYLSLNNDDTRSVASEQSIEYLGHIKNGKLSNNKSGKHLDQSVTNEVDDFKYSQDARMWSQQYNLFMTESTRDTEIELDRNIMDFADLNVENEETAAGSSVISPSRHHKNHIINDDQIYQSHKSHYNGHYIHGGGHHHVGPHLHHPMDRIHPTKHKSNHSNHTTPHHHQHHHHQHKKSRSGNNRHHRIGNNINVNVKIILFDFLFLIKMHISMHFFSVPFLDAISK